MGVFSEDSTGALEVDKVAPFLLKLYEIVSSPVSDDLVCWSEHGETFKIVNRTKFAREGSVGLPMCLAVSLSISGR